MGFEIMGTEHLKARCICSGDTPDTGCPLHQKPTTVKPDMINHPPHYKHHPSGVEAIEVARHMAFDAGNTFKYVYRTDLKNGLEDIGKARWYWRDVTEHGLPIWLPAAWQYAKTPMMKIIDLEPDPVRRKFFQGIGFGARVAVTEAIDEMLAA